MIGKLIILLGKVGINGFLLGIFAAIFLGWLFPYAGADSSPFPWKPIINVGIALVFFLYGVKLDPVQLRAGLRNWKLHLLIQSTTFLIFPALVLLLASHLPRVNSDFQLGIYYLSVLPSTVSASVVLVSIARGNIPAAIFNASISSLLGVVITPAWMDLLGNGAQGDVEFLPTFLELTYKVILPVFIGVLCHGKLFPKIQPFLNRLKYIDQTVIMLIVFTAFSNSFERKVFAPYKISTLLEVSFTMLSIFILMWFVIYFLCRLMGFTLEDKITALFCASKKSLVHGVIIGNVIFPDPATVGLVLLPVMLYHIQQLILGSIIASRLGRRI